MSEYLCVYVAYRDSLFIIARTLNFARHPICEYSQELSFLEHFRPNYVIWPSFPNYSIWPSNGFKCFEKCLQLHMI